MEITTLCTIVASLRVFPSSTQLFWYDSVTLSCGEHERRENASEWRVKRNTSTHKEEECPITWGKRNESQCVIEDVYPSDTGVYWCESGAGECSNAVNITVTGGSVILESPVLPVQDGEAATLRCTNKTASSSNLTAEFYKDGLLVGRSSTGNMTIHNVSKSDEGLYKCTIPGAGESPDSWLSVRVEAGRPQSLPSPCAHVLLPVVGVFLLLASAGLLFLWRRCKGKIDADISYTEVSITQEVQPKRDREMVDTTTLYSTIKPGAT